MYVLIVGVLYLTGTL